jgi:hypothetical protein
MPLREGAQFLVNERGQLTERGFVPAAPFGEQLRDRSIRAVIHGRSPANTSWKNS